MIIRAYGKNYKVNSNLAMSSKKMILSILNKVREQASVKGIDEYYVAFVIMMYAISSTILSELSEENIRRISEKK